MLDNCEHLIAACAELVEALLRQAPALRILATSREALGVAGETICHVPSLSIPEALAPVRVDGLLEVEATQLFVERASAGDPAFRLTPDNADAIAHICRRLDGIPLAIELAAARVVVLSPMQIEARLQDRFRLLTGGVRTAVARQRTLEATVDWSYHYCRCRAAFTRPTVGISRVDARAAERSVEARASTRMSSICYLGGQTKSLVIVDSEFAGDAGTACLRTVRQYAREQLEQAGTTDRLRERHFEFSSAVRGALPSPATRAVAVSQAAAG